MDADQVAQRRKNSEALRDQELTVEPSTKRPVADGTYHGRITGVEAKQYEPNPLYENDTGERLIFSVEIAPPGEDFRTLKGFCSKKWSRKAKLFEWVTAILGPQNVFEKPNIAATIGQEVMVKVGTSKDGDFNVINDLVAMPR